MLNIPLTLAQAAASLYVLFICVMVLHAMTRSTRHLIRLTYVLLGAGSLCGAVTALSAPTFANALLVLGVALYLACNERRARHAA